MQAPCPDLSHLRRPRLLMEAVRLALRMGECREARSAVAINGMIAAEADMEAARKSGLATYSPSKHIALLVALIGSAAPSSAERPS